MEPGKTAQAGTPVPHGPSELDGIVAGGTPALPPFDTFCERLL